jgi:hypothetical protein
MMMLKWMVLGTGGDVKRKKKLWDDLGVEWLWWI